MSKKFYGSVTVGERGQVVIPASARTQLNIRQGEKLLVFKMKDDAILFSKASGVEKFVEHMESKLGNIRKILSKDGLAEEKNDRK